VGFFKACAGKLENVDRLKVEETDKICSLLEHYSMLPASRLSLGRLLPSRACLRFP